MNLSKHDMQQGNAYLNLKQDKIKKINVDHVQKSNKIQGIMNYSKDYHVVEGFTGAFGKSKANDKNDRQTKETETSRMKFDKTLSEYGIAQKHLMSETSSFLNNASSTGKSATLRNSIIRMQNGAVGYVTDKNTFKYIGSPDILTSIKGKNGCPSQVTNVDFTSDNYKSVGDTLGTNPDLFVGTSMALNESCAPTSINLQVLGASDPLQNKAEWLGCYNNTGDFFNPQNDISGVDASITLDRCHHRAADIGSSAFFIGHDEDNSYACFTSKPGMSAVQIQNGMELGYITSIGHTIYTTNTLDPNSSLLPGAGIMNNGQIGIGNVPNGATNFASQVQNVSIKNDMEGIVNCDPVYGARINLQTANYGANCNGQVKNSDSDPWVVAQNNWFEATKNSIDAGDGRSGSISIWPSPDPAKGCRKQYVATYTCSPNTNVKTVDIAASADGFTASFDCSQEYSKCLTGILTLGDDGNVSLSNNSEIIYQSGPNPVGIAQDQYKSINGKYGRNYLKTGEYLLSNEFIGSPSGNCALMCIDEGNGTANLSIVYFTWGCNKPNEMPSTNSGEYGFITNKPNIRATYTLHEDAIDNSNRGKVVYSDNNANKREYPNEMVSLGQTYIDVGNYDQPNESIKITSNSDLSACKSQCNAISECYGFVHYKDEQKCNLRRATDMFPNNENRVMNDKAKMFIRQFEIANPSSCTSDVNSTTGNIFNNMSQAENMSSTTLCDLGEALHGQVQELTDKENALMYEVKNVSNKLTRLNKQNSVLTNDLIQSMKKTEKENNTYKKVIHNIHKKENELVNINAMEKDTDLAMISENMHYIAWTTVATLSVILGIKAMR